MSSGCWPARRAGSPSEKAETALETRQETNQSARRLEPQERLDWLRLSRTDGIGPVTFYALLRRFGSAAAALDALPRLSRPVTAMSRRDAEAALVAIERIGARPVCWGEPLYPTALAAVEDAPPVLTVLGRPEILSRMLLAPMVAVVGARNASANGRRLARELAAGLGESGIVVVSGLARGIDAAAHLGALATGSVAIVAGGVDIVYPEENRGLHEALARDGAIVAELPLGTEPQARHFPRRNRIISGVALGVVVVEAAAKSGSLITARFALEQGREVFAVPGSPLDPRSRGTNDLLRSGATLTETAADIIAQLGPLLHGRPPAPDPGSEPRLNLREVGLREVGPRVAMAGPLGPLGEDDALELIVEYLGATPVAVDELVRQCQLSAAAVATLLLELELAGRIERHPGNLVSLR
jgi:DNA processing protein